jgi:predicted NACHT family NTPase
MTTDSESPSITNRSGGTDLDAQGNINIGGDTIGRDKVTSVGGHSIHAESGSTVIIGGQATPAPQDPLADFGDPAFDEALQKYRQQMREMYSTTRMLGKPEPIALEGIFTDVFLLDRPTALQRFDIEKLKAQHGEYGSFRNTGQRVSALRLAVEKDRLFILGKPGAGKTTFLKYFTLRAATGDVDRVPIFISLNEWASSGLGLLAFIARQFEICAFPEASAYIQHLLKRGAALVCFDGLDEVNEADDKRAAITRAMRDFTNQYPGNKVLITCRIAATNYTFEKFTYVEMADFTLEQVQVFACKWFASDAAKAQRFVDELQRPEHRGLRELAQTPLLLTLLCLNFEETLTFPTRRAELYEEALDALLKKWDASRNLKRDEMYHDLSLGRKRQLFMRVAAEFFERDEIFFRQADLAQRISAFLKHLPGNDAADESVGEVVLKAVEAQHGLFVERAHRIYSFSHLTLQEYFTARYIVEHAADGALERLIKNRFTDRRWREVFLLTASMLPEADAFFAAFQRALDDMLCGDERLLAYSRWAAHKAADYAYFGHPALARAAVRAITALDLALDLALDHAQSRDRALARALDRALDLALALDRALDRDRGYDRALDRALDRVRALARDRDLDLDLARDRDRTLVRDRALARARALDLARALARALARDLARDLDRALDLARALDLDLAFIFAWRFARLEYREGIRQLLPRLAQASAQTGQTEFAQALNNLPLPAEQANTLVWEAYAFKLQALLIRYRNIGHEWNFTDEQEQRLDQYEQGTLFLVECLNLAAVSDRKAIENRLLLPPEE